MYVRWAHSLLKRSVGRVSPVSWCFANCTKRQRYIVHVSSSGSGRSSSCAAEAESTTRQVWQESRARRSSKEIYTKKRQRCPLQHDSKHQEQSANERLDELNLAPYNRTAHTKSNPHIARLDGLKRTTRLIDGGFVVAPVLHELRGKLYSIPFHSVDAGAVPVNHGGQHVLKAVPELVEQRLHLDWCWQPSRGNEEQNVFKKWGGPPRGRASVVGLLLRTIPGGRGGNPRAGHDSVA